MKPILFNTEMVQAILEGRKTCTRRIIKRKYENADITLHENKCGKRLVYMQNDTKDITHEDGTRTCQIRAYEDIKRPYEIGDILYVREMWTVEGVEFENKWVAYIGYKAEGNTQLGFQSRIEIKEDEVEKYEGYIYFGDSEYKPSIHMPKKAARIFLRVKDVRSERLHNMSEKDAEREGIISSSDEHCFCLREFIELWDSTIKKDKLPMYGWYSNPWVWVIDFEVIESQ